MADKTFSSTTQTLDRLRKSGDLSALTRRKKPAQDGPSEIPLADIQPDPDQPRRQFDPEKLHSLANSIRAQGVLQAITVQPAGEDGTHRLIMGERRFRAAKLAGLDRIPAVVKELSNTLRMAQLTENVQRADLTTLEIAEAVAAMRAAGQSRRDVAQALGWSEGEVSRFGAVMSMPEELRDAAAQNAPIRAIADLNTLWKKDPQAVHAFLGRTDVADISRFTVDALRTEIEAGLRKQDEAPRDPDALNLAPSPKVAELHSPSSGAEEEAGRANILPETSPDSRAGALTLFVRHGHATGQVLLDRPASNPKSLFVSFDDGKRIEEVALCELALVEARPR
ncbi:hypothetical protein P775_04310 [Puniceibacterium antarcticum]|uniref:ParB-like N-terminal domain-containing protein n=1 Tax=Puniceibacterium antarcticum TaxID=1206336 RepID=A0A2G8RIQ8_9RHOB|nr:ParB/RepB/Spo0J family partition protein [Puniceibacterium antarcticum]PIL21449.1 hypothetical protein P775_04310 [Puniceibacterium antarcticum]